MLSILASFAQEESRSISENVKWGTIKRFKQGIPNGKFSIFGYEWQDDKLVIIPEEAEIIRWMYAEYMKGASRIEIGRALMDRGIYTRQGKPWVDSNVKVILTNITYTGNMLFQKEYCEDPITKHRRKNYGELPQYFVEDTHEAIIPMDEWQAVQDEFKRRRDLGPFGNKSLIFHLWFLLGFVQIVFPTVMQLGVGVTFQPKSSEGVFHHIADDPVRGEKLRRSRNAFLRDLDILLELGKGIVL